MKTANTALINLLQLNHEFKMVDLLTITLADDPVTPTVLRYSLGDFKVTFGANLFVIDGPIIERGDVRVSRGLSVDDLELTVQNTNLDLQLLGMAYIKAIALGAFDGAKVLLQRGFMDEWSGTIVDALYLFSGRVSALGDMTRWSVQVRVTSDTELLNVKLPRNVFTPNCPLNVYSPTCALDRDDFTVTGSVTQVLNQRVRFDTGRTEAVDYFNQGVLMFTSGANAGKSRSVKTYPGSGIFEFALPWGADVAVGDDFLVYPGCDKTMATCEDRFDNLPHFRGFPFIPAPETIT